MDYALIKNGSVQNVIVADAAFAASIARDWDHIEPLDTLHEQGLGVGIGWRYESGEFIAPEAALVEPDARVTVLAFRNRFTQAEKVAIELAQTDDPALDAPTRTAKAGLRAYMSDLAAASFVDLSRVDTIEGVERLEAMGLIATGRADEVLTAPIQEIERPK